MSTVTNSGGYATRRKRAAELTPAEVAEVKAAARAAGKAKAAAALAKLDAGVADILANDDAFAEYLRCAGRMHHYSWGNRLLIMLQRPDASMVAGYHRWAELGRPVCKGSKGIQILAPIVAKRTETDPDTGETTEAGRLVGFRVAYVFAAEDTDGAPMGHPAAIAPDDDSDDAKALASRLQAATTAAGIPWEMRSPEADPLLASTRGGYFQHDPPLIVCDSTAPAAMQVKCLSHELAHALAEHGENGEDDRRDREAVAEGASFIVCAFYGLDTSAFTAPYIAGWAQDIRRLRRLLDRIAKVSDAIIDHAESAGCSHCGWDGVADGGCEHCR